MLEVRVYSDGTWLCPFGWGERCVCMYVRERTDGRWNESIGFGADRWWGSGSMMHDEGEGDMIGKGKGRRIGVMCVCGLCCFVRGRSEGSPKGGASFPDCYGVQFGWPATLHARVR